MYSDKTTKLTAASAAMGLLAGCGMFGGEPEAEAPVAAAEKPAAAQVRPYGNDSDRNVKALRNAQEAVPMPTGKVVYFDFDRAVVRAEAREALRAHAEYMARKGVRKVTLAGHADERGTREYNMALGEERSRAVRKVLVAYGVDPEKLETVSYGEELPVVTGHDERSWALNRRVELKYE